MQDAKEKRRTAMADDAVSTNDPPCGNYVTTCGEILEVVNKNRLGFELSLKALLAVAGTIITQEREAQPFTLPEKLFIVELAQVLFHAGKLPAVISLS